MPECRKLKFSNFDQLVNDVALLRRGGYEKIGEWSLPQIAFHLNYPIAHSNLSPTNLEPTDEQRGFQRFINMVNDAGAWPANPGKSPVPMLPPADAPDSVVDDLIASIRMFDGYNGSHVDAFLFGPIETQKLRTFALIHAAHHLSYLVPKLQRRANLRFSDEAEVIAELERLRRGYVKAGNWSLGQICWHLSTATNGSMRPGPFPPLTPEQVANRAKLETVMKSGQIPDGIVAPEQAIPPAECADAEIERFADVLEKARTFPGPFAPHRIFGSLSNDEARRLRLLHSARHLSFLVPAQQES